MLLKCERELHVYWPRLKKKLYLSIYLSYILCKHMYFKIYSCQMLRKCKCPSHSSVSEDNLGEQPLAGSVSWTAPCSVSDVLVMLADKVTLKWNTPLSLCLCREEQKSSYSDSISAHTVKKWSVAIIWSLISSTMSDLCGRGWGKDMS